MAAASPLPISISEYLHTSYQPDCDYVDGIVETRNVGASDHSGLQRALLAFVGRHGRQWGVHARQDIRIQTSASHVRVADVAILSLDEPTDQVVEKPPIVVIEILSPEDRIPRHTERLEDYRHMGVKALWVIDPAARKGFDCSSGAWTETERFAAQESSVRIDLAALFAAIDEHRAR